MISRYQEVRKLSVNPLEHPRGLSFLSAASGLVRVHGRYCVVADDELHLGVFDVGSAAPLRLVRLFEGELPSDPVERKASKPDLEALLVLPASAEAPCGALLALGSGSRRNRFAGALISLDDARDVLGGVARPVDLEPLYRGLATRFEALDIEGAFVVGEELVLLQRGHERGPNATVRFDLAPVMAWVMGGQTAPLRPTAIREFDLGTADGVPFSFTDGAALPDGAWLFSAVAEDTDSSYADGPCVATMIGSVNRDGALQATHRLLPTRKIEGIEARVLGDAIEISMVSDADDPGCPAEFGVARMSIRP